MYMVVSPNIVPF